MVYEMDNDINLMWGLENYGTLLTKNTGKEIVPVPSITASSLSFKDSLWISIDDIVKDATLEITLNGRKHVKGSKILLKQSTVVTAKAKIGEEFSQAVTAKFYKIDPNVAIKVKPSYAPQYAAGGDYALIDKRVGGDNFRTGTYQGYQGSDVELVLDLGSVKNLSSVQIGSLQDIRSWIWLPQWVNFEVSEDGLVFNQLEKVESQLASDNYNATKQNFKVQKTFKSRYIKITAKNQGNCPEWHLGAGNPSWIFLDEISWEFK